MDKEKLTWRSFADPGDVGQGAIATRWNLSGTPTLYVIDPKGVIRHKWVGSPGEKSHRRGPGQADQRGGGERSAVSGVKRPRPGRFALPG